MAEPPKTKKPKRVCHFDREWTKEFRGIGTSSKGKLVASCACSLLSGVCSLSCIVLITHAGSTYARCSICSVLLMVAEMMS